MREEILKQVQEEYELEKQKRKELQIKQKRLEELKQNELVDEYLKLSKELRANQTALHATDGQILRMSFMSKINEGDETNNMYVYIGTYMHPYVSFSGRVRRVEYTSPYADYRWFTNLECSYDYMQIPIDKSPEFEKNHSIIYFNNTNFYKIQEEFIILALKYGQKEACEQLLKKYSFEAMKL